ncbi:STAS-like domain-containing protein [Rhodobacter capsulatus]|uniref:STAS-like domain-containing protein n=1 Tax=Rhodobacter capsulatus TaxID=1061 RepID=UPI0009BCEB46|nr:STAS-like domain-containing protein [Rhodobacter capsulatus]QNR63107.1 STAS-like domain-containing protein [Rhodobacter capsulatus]
MTKVTRITISSIVDGGICVAASDGQKVYRALHEVIERGGRAEISFFGVTRMTTAFLNAAVGQLYGEFDEATLKSRLASPVDFEDWHLRRLKLVVDRAKLYFSDRERVEAVYRDNLED